MVSTTRIQETLIAFSRSKQTNIATPNTTAGMWRLHKVNAALVNPKLVTEDDAAELGKGHEFATALYATSWDVAGTLEKYLGAEIAAWAIVFGLGKCVKTGSTPHFIYTCTPPIPSAGEAVELPYFSYVEQIRPGANVVLDRLVGGCAVEGWTISVGSGPGRANSKINIEFVGSGKVVEPSAITMPAATAEKLLPSASLALSINGVDYVTAKNVVSLETGWKNNIRLDTGFYPGSGFQAWAGKTFTADPDTEVLSSVGHGMQDGAEVTVSGAALPTGLTAGVVYHVVGATADTFKLSLTEGGDPVNITAAGTPPHTVTVVPATTGAIRGRLEYGNRAGTLKFVARFMSGSAELAKLRSLTTGTAVLTLTYDTNNSLSITWQKVAFAMAEVGETDGILTVSVECTPMYHASNGLITAVVRCDVDGIGEVEA
ncbi:MAG: hypothetical protein HY822_12375 [Acidobacteria bacterium]|nr:hypothetical protein [Acidobacteriota bacterium]